MNQQARMRRMERRAAAIGLSLAVILVGSVVIFVSSRGGFMYLAGSAVFGAIVHVAHLIHHVQRHPPSS